MESELNIIAERQHPDIQRKLSMWRLINVSYIGGEEYLKSNNLFQYQRENTRSYAARRKRTVYYNYTQPIADMLSGFLFTQPPSRDYNGADYLIEKASKTSSLNAFMQKVSVQSHLYTCGVLVDSPRYNQDEYPTLQARKESGLNPYCILYRPWEIRDFDVDENNNLNWVILDNTRYDSTSPYDKREVKRIFTLWERDTVTEFNIGEADQKSSSVKTKVTILNKYEHGLGKVPFKFVNWRDVDENNIAESPFEDVALISRAIFNVYSWVDESLAAGTFRTLFFPIQKKDDIPEGIQKEGFGHLPVFPFPGGVGQPFFGGVDISNIDYYVQAIGEHLKHILNKFGMNPESDKLYVQSGRAKSVEFEKCEAILRHGAENMAKLEQSIFEFAGLWEQQEITGTSVYTQEYQQEDVGKETERLTAILALPYQRLKKEVAKLIVRKNLATNLDAQVLEEINEEIDSTEVPVNMSMGNNEPGARNNTGQPDTTAQADKQEKIQ